MKKHELLVPAGDMDCLRQAVFHGADAVYLACKNFGARKFATNFSNEEIVEAIRFCHLYGVKLYVTMNTLIRNSEVDSYLEQARFLHQQGVDALIVQDFGMICLLREKFPNLEIHASTQANNSSLDTCRMFQRLGVKRVVFSRELSIDEIDSMDVDIEKEAFIHGALCVSYSGCCLMSSMLGGRSGNRGECAGSCRLPYSLYKGEKLVRKECYLLSMKELNTSSQIKRLLESSIYSFKIEGRMKGPLYVAFITNFYRKLMDGEAIDFEKMTNQLKTIFNREFTLGHMFGIEGPSLINHHSPNHVGLEIGTATCRKNKILLKLKPGCVLHQYDSIRFLHSNKGMVVNYLYDSKDNLCNMAKNECYVDNKVLLDQDDVLTKTQDCMLEKEYVVSDSIVKIPVSYSVFAKVGKCLRISITDGVHSITREGHEVQKAISNPTDRDTLKEKLSKLGNTPFVLDDISFDLDDDIFLPMKMVNDLRRDLVDALKEERMKNSIPFVEKDIEFSLEEASPDSYGFVASVQTEEQLKTCLDLSFKRISVTNLELYETYKKYPNVYYDLGRCSLTYEDRLKEKNVVSDLMDFSKSCVFGNYFLNVTNIYTAYYLRKMGLLNIPLSCELTDFEIEEFLSLYLKKFGKALLEVFAYGRVENMVIKGNLLNIPKDDTSYTLVDSKKRRFPIFFDGEKSHIYHCERRSGTSIFSCCDFYFVFLDETSDEIISAVKNF